MYIVPYCTVYLNHVYSTLQCYSTQYTSVQKLQSWPFFSVAGAYIWMRFRLLQTSLNFCIFSDFNLKKYKSLNLSNLKQKSFLCLIFLCIVWKLYAENNYQYGLFWGVWKLKKFKCQYYTILYRAGPGSRAWAEPDRKRIGSATLISIAHSVELSINC